MSMVTFKLFAATALALSTSLGVAVAGELDGKMAICEFPATAELKRNEILLNFSQEQVTVLSLSTKKRMHAEYNFEYDEVSIEEDVDQLYVTAAQIFWSRITGESADGASSPDEATTAVLLGGIGTFYKIDRYTLKIKYGIYFDGTGFTRDGECQMLDENSFNLTLSEYQKMVDAAKMEMEKSAQDSKAKKQKL